MNPSSPFIRAAAKLFVASLLTSITACGGQSTPETQVEPDDTVPQINYTPEMLAQYRSILPTHEVLDAPAPTATVNAQIGNRATYPALAAPQIMAVNQVLSGIIDTLGDVTALEPTLYNSETKEFLWGPFDNDDSPMADDKVLVYIQENAEGADFDYTYAFIRTKGADVANWTPVIWGGANPDDDEPDVYGDGVLLYDFEANADFIIANNTDVTREDLQAGRFAVAYMRKPDDNAVNSDVTAVVSVFRNFRGPGEEAVNFEQLYGRVENFDDGNAFEFANIESSVNIDLDNGTLAKEDVSMRLAFFNRGIGRAEAVVTGGDLTSATGESTLSAVECWDDVLARSHYEVTASGERVQGNESIVVETEGASAACGFFESTLDALGVPSLEDLDGDLLNALSDVAENGLGE